MARIDRLRTDLYRIPLPTTLTDSTHGAMPDFELVTVRVTDTDGQEGLGYTFTVGAGGAAIHVMIDRYLRDVIVGHDVDTTEHLWQASWWALHYAGRGGHLTSALSAVDIAVWDLRARRAELPLWRFLGGHDPKVPVYAGGIDLEMPLPALLEQADAFVERGFRAIKMKVGRDALHEDVERVTAMRHHLGDGFPLMVDANMRWSADQAIRAAHALRDLDLTWLEEPTIPDDVAGHARVVRDGGVPVASGENLHTLYEFRRLIEAGGVTYPEPDPSNCGGVTVFRKIAALAEAANLPVTTHGVHDLAIHLLAATPHRSYMEFHGFSLDRFTPTPLPIENGHATAPERPGHGITLDWPTLAPHAA